MSTGKVVLGAIAGLATGAILGILFAPEKGTDTRKKIARKSKESLDEVKSKYDDVIASLSGKLESVKKEASHLFEDGKDLMNEAKHDASKLSEAGKNFVQDAKIRASNQL